MVFQFPIPGFLSGLCGYLFSMTSVFPVAAVLNFLPPLRDQVPDLSVNNRLGYSL